MVAATSAVAPAARRVNVEVLSVSEFIGRLKVAAAVLVTGTLTGPCAGVIVTLGPPGAGVGGTGAEATTVKLQVKSEPIAVPSSLVTLPARVTVYTDPFN